LDIDGIHVKTKMKMMIQLVMLALPLLLFRWPIWSKHRSTLSWYRWRWVDHQLGS